MGPSCHHLRKVGEGLKRDQMGFSGYSPVNFLTRITMINSITRPKSEKILCPEGDDEDEAQPQECEAPTVISSSCEALPSKYTPRTAIKTMLPVQIQNQGRVASLGIFSVARTRRTKK
ncbi:hypothetical protein X802_10110 [Thermococcus guaymasensis DSM 11113]|uniref:Uncharacterized protein n=1 Tax=Thermococcus guaymasensis DSM 11113 TaxID=1432656 RepID=A0A0X1KNM1_9EURY|nr:hypothetical protein X802_10110 [Thermococcus guaymasensis DSM 11113]